MHKILISGFCTQDHIEGEEFFGGAAGGIALNLASLGIPVGLLSVLGPDQFSTKYRDELQKRSVDLSLVAPSEYPIPELTVHSDSGRELDRTFDDHGNKQFLSDLVFDPQKLTAFDFLHAVNTPRELCDRLAHSFTGEISYSPGGLFIRDPYSLSTQLLIKTSYLFLNEEEAHAFESLVDVESLFKKKLQMVSISHGREGVEMVTKNSIQTITVPTVSVLDTTGGGDAIVVGFLSTLYKGGTPKDGLQQGIQYASSVIQTKGVLLS